ncbi:hypothetical protein [Chitinophaga sp. YR573]|uniref:hypothetical protein n=1 Tax=Chitinophaga sp. YR573 TaxID=1881040 RepID=UPI000B7E64E3|nr:hypothetical protein [Chitinophaga sp. YR573]
MKASRVAEWARKRVTHEPLTLEIRKKSHVILKVFNNMGSEGKLTKIITEENEANYAAQLKGLPQDEIGLIIYKKDECNWG